MGQTGNKGGMTMQAATEPETGEGLHIHTLRDHCRHLGLRSAKIHVPAATSNDAKGSTLHLHRIDVTREYQSSPVGGGDGSNVNGNDNDNGSNVPPLKDMVTEYCSPLALTYLQADMFIGLSSMGRSGSNTNEDTSESLPVRTMTMRIRPDSSSADVMKAVARVFDDDWPMMESTAITLGSSEEMFLGIAAVSADCKFVFNAQLVTCKTRQLERVLLLRFFYVEDVLLEPIIMNQAKDLKMTAASGMDDGVGNGNDNGNDQWQGAINNVNRHTDPSSPQNVPNATSDRTPEGRRSSLREACALIQVLYPDSIAYHGSDRKQLDHSRYVKSRQDWNQQALSDHLHAWAAELDSPSIRKENERRSSTKGFNADKGSASRARSQIFPALCREDWILISGTDGFLHRCWKELRDGRMAYSTLLNPMDGFGLRPPYIIIDERYGRQIGMLTRQDLVTELKVSLPHVLSSQNESNHQHRKFLLLLQYAIRKYHVVLPQHLIMVLKEPDDDLIPLVRNVVSNVSTDVNLPWPDEVQKAVVAITDRISDSRGLPAESLQMANDAVKLVFEAFQRVADEEQQRYLKDFNRSTMRRLAERQEDWKAILHSVCKANTNRANVEAHRWHGIALQAQNTEGRLSDDLLRSEVPLLEFDTFTGKGCVTVSCLICVSTIAFRTTVKVYVLSQVQFVASSNSLAKLSVLHEGRKVYGFNPSIGAEDLVQFIQMLQSLAAA